MGLLLALQSAAPADVRILPAPLHVRFSPTRQLQPDIIVVPPGPTTPKLDKPPLLVVEMLSPSTRATDLTLKRHVFEQAGVPSYWLLDTEVPSLAVLELVDGAYIQIATASGADRLVIERPFPLTVVPADLMR